MSNARLISRVFTYDNADLIYPERDVYVVFCKNNNSFGNRYESSDQVLATKKHYSEGYEIAREQAETLIHSFEWNQMFDLIEHGIFSGPATLDAVDRAALIVKSTDIPQEDPKEILSIWNGTTNVRVSNRVKTYMDLQGRVGSIITTALSTDRANGRLLSPDWQYYRNIQSGWSRST